MHCKALAAKPWRHPVSTLDIRFSVSTLERWYYAARRSGDPVAALKVRLGGDIGRFPSLMPQVIDVLTTQYREHPGWTMQLHFDNLRAALKGQDSQLHSALPFYPTICSYLLAKDHTGALQHRLEPAVTAPARKLGLVLGMEMRHVPARKAALVQLHILVHFRPKARRLEIWLNRLSSSPSRPSA